MHLPVCGKFDDLISVRDIPWPQPVLTQLCGLALQCHATSLLRSQLTVTHIGSSYPISVGTHTAEGKSQQNWSITSKLCSNDRDCHQSGVVVAIAGMLLGNRLKVEKVF